MKAALLAIGVMMWDGFSNPSAAARAAASRPDGLENPSHIIQRMVRAVSAKNVEQTVVNVCARSDLDAAARLTPIADDCHRAAASDFAIRQD